MTEAPEQVWIQSDHIPDSIALDRWDVRPDADEAHLFTGYIRKDVSDALVAAAREEALREADRNLSVYAPTLVDGPEHDVGYYHGYSTAMNRILDMLQEDFPHNAKKPNLVGTGVQMGILKKNPAG